MISGKSCSTIFSRFVIVRYSVKSRSANCLEKKKKLTEKNITTLIWCLLLYVYIQGNRCVVLANRSWKIRCREDEGQSFWFLFHYGSLNRVHTRNHMHVVDTRYHFRNDVIVVETHFLFCLFVFFFFFYSTIAIFKKQRPLQLVGKFTKSLIYVFSCLISPSAAA